MTDEKVLDTEERIRKIEERLDKLNPESIEQQLDQLEAQSKKVFGTPEEDSETGEFFYTNGLQQNLEEKLKTLTEELSQIEEAHQKIQSKNTELYKFYEKIYGNDDQDENGLEKHLILQQEVINELEADIKSYYDALLITDNSIKEQIATTKNDAEHSLEFIKESQAEIKNILEKVEDQVFDLNLFYAKIFGEKSKNKDGLAKELENNQGKYQALIEHVESLLPGATSAGLASAYKELKESLKRPIIIANSSFIISLVIIFVLALSMLGIKISPFPAFNYANFSPSSLYDLFIFFSLRLLAIAPLSWVALYSSQRAKQFMKLQQEYAHKESLASSYISFKKQVDALDASDEQKKMLEKLLNSTIEGVSYNAANKIDVSESEYPLDKLIKNFEKINAAVVPKKDK